MRWPRIPLNIFKHQFNHRQFKLDEIDLVIGIVGPDGSGKSFLFGKLTGDDRNVNHALKPFRSETKIAEVSGIFRSDRRIIFLDTPGYEDNDSAEGKALDECLKYLKRIHPKPTLSCTLYLHKIQGTDVRLGSSNISSFKELCGDLRSIRLTTTTAGNKVDEAERLACEAKLMDHLLIKRGGVLKQFSGTVTSGWDLIDDLIRDSNDQFEIALQSEMAVLGKVLGSKHEGLFSELKGLVEQQRSLLRRIRGEASQENELGHGAQPSLEVEYENGQSRLGELVRKIQALKFKPTFGKHLLRFISAPLK